MNVISRILSIMDQKGLKITELAVFLNIRQGSVSSWKLRNTDPPTKYLVPIAKFLGVSLDYLLTGEEPSTSSHDVGTAKIITHITTRMQQQSNELLTHLQAILPLLPAGDVYSWDLTANPRLHEHLAAIASLLHCSIEELLFSNTSDKSTAVFSHVPSPTTGSSINISEEYALSLFQSLSDHQQELILQQLKQQVSKKEKKQPKIAANDIKSGDSFF